MHQIIDYFHLLDKASRRVHVQEMGKTTMGNPFIIAIITSEENHRNLETYRNIQQSLVDPRKISDSEAEKMIAEGKTVVMINCSIHASEIGACQMSLELAYDLAVREEKSILRILDNVILLLFPMHNPDGIQMVVDWFRKNLGTKYEGSRMPWLYHKYVGHDNNRDWFMFTQVETQLTVKVHNVWHPHVIVDMHQMGSNGARLFVPPFVDPYEPNVDPILRQQVAMMGTYIASELTAQGKAGVQHSSGFDAWTPARAYHHYHGGVRILTEAASVKIATPITVDFEKLRPEVREKSVRMPLPWKGGKWTLRDIVEYDYSAAMAALTNAAALRENWVRNYYRIFKKAVNRKEPPYAYIIPEGQKDVATVIKMLQILRTGGAEIHRSEEPFEADGYVYPLGSFVIYMGQPFGAFAKALLERQAYPEIREYPGAPLKMPYDVVGHTLPLLMGVEAVEVRKPFQAKATLMEKIKKPRGGIKAKGKISGYVWGHASNDDIVALNRLLHKGHEVFWSVSAFTADGKVYPRGTMMVRQREGLLDDLRSIVNDMLVDFEGISVWPVLDVLKIKEPRIGLYKSWVASMDEGWTRFVLEQFEFPYQSISNRHIRRGLLEKDFDVIIFPDMGNRTIVQGIPEAKIPPEYAGGIEEVGIKNIKDFISKGGALITLNAAAEFAIESLYLGVEDKVDDLDRKDFFIPGSLLKVINDTTHPIAFGYERDSAIFFRRSPVFSVKEGESVIQYPAHTLLSGWATGQQYLTHESALVDVPFGKGRVILIGFPAQYRAQSHGSFRYLFNAIFYGASERGPLD